MIIKYHTSSSASPGIEGDGQLDHLGQPVAAALVPEQPPHLLLLVHVDDVERRRAHVDAVHVDEEPKLGRDGAVG